MITDYTAKILNENRLRDAAKAYAHEELIREASTDNVGLFQQVKQMIHLPSRQVQPQALVTVRPAHAA